MNSIFIGCESKKGIYVLDRTSLELVKKFAQNVNVKLLKLHKQYCIKNPISVQIGSKMNSIFIGCESKKGIYVLDRTSLELVKKFAQNVNVKLLKLHKQYCIKNPISVQIGSKMNSIFIGCESKKGIYVLDRTSLELVKKFAQNVNVKLLKLHKQYCIKNPISVQIGSKMNSIFIGCESKKGIYVLDRTSLELVKKFAQNVNVKLLKLHKQYCIKNPISVQIGSKMNSIFIGCAFNEGIYVLEMNSFRLIMKFAQNVNVKLLKLHKQYCIKNPISVQIGSKMNSIFIGCAFNEGIYVLEMNSFRLIMKFAQNVNVKLLKLHKQYCIKNPISVQIVSKMNSIFIGCAFNEGIYVLEMNSFRLIMKFAQNVNVKLLKLHKQYCIKNPISVQIVSKMNSIFIGCAFNEGIYVLEMNSFRLIMKFAQNVNVKLLKLHKQYCIKNPISVQIVSKMNSIFIGCAFNEGIYVLEMNSFRLIMKFAQNVNVKLLKLHKQYCIKNPISVQIVSKMNSIFIGCAFNEGIYVLEMNSFRLIMKFAQNVNVKLLKLHKQYCIKNPISVQIGSKMNSIFIGCAFNEGIYVLEMNSFRLIMKFAQNVNVKLLKLHKQYCIKNPISVQIGSKMNSIFIGCAFNEGIYVLEMNSFRLIMKFAQNVNVKLLKLHKQYCIKNPISVQIVSKMNSIFIGCAFNEGIYVLEMNSFRLIMKFAQNVNVKLLKLHKQYCIKNPISVQIGSKMNSIFIGCAFNEGIYVLEMNSFRLIMKFAQNVNVKLLKLHKQYCIKNPISVQIGSKMNSIFIGCAFNEGIYVLEMNSFRLIMKFAQNVNVKLLKLHKQYCIKNPISVQIVSKMNSIFIGCAFNEGIYVLEMNSFRLIMKFAQNVNVKLLKLHKQYCIKNPISVQIVSKMNSIFIGCAFNEGIYVLEMNSFRLIMKFAQNVNVKLLKLHKQYCIKNPISVQIVSKMNSIFIGCAF